MRAPKNRATRHVRWLGGLLTLTLMTVAGPAGAGPFEELSAGEWRGSGEASGVTAGGGGGVLIEITGVVAADLEFSVLLDGSVNDGRWELADGVTFWNVAMGESAGTSILLHTGEGRMSGDSRRLEAEGGTVTSVGRVEVPGAPPIEIDSAGAVETFDLGVTETLCSEAWGEWIFSWNAQLSGAALSPTFAGNWHAIRVTVEGDDALREQIENLAPEILNLRQEMVSLWQQPQESGVPIFPASGLWSLLERAVALVNEFNNLNRCERALLGEDVIAEYVNALTNMVVLLANVWLDNAALDGRTPSVEELVELMTTLGAVGGIGPGAVDQDAARVTEGRLRSELRSAVEAQTSAALASAGEALLGEGP